MEFQALSKTCALFSKSFAKDLLRLLVVYRDISASEAASRLNLHIKTAQDFLEGLTSLSIVSKVEVTEKKRPYYRYSLIEDTIHMRFDLRQLRNIREGSGSMKTRLIREKKKAECTFRTASRGDRISTITLFSGSSRNREERKIILTENQGKFLYYLPFPTEDPRSIQDILKRAKIDTVYEEEILDIVNFLSDRGVIEFFQE